jgi:hypothetical protein
MISVYRRNGIITVCLLLVSLLLVGCMGSRDLTRSRAEQLIQNSPTFSRPAILKLDSDQIDVQTKSVDEPESDLQGRAVSRFYERRPVMRVLKQMDFVDTTVTTTQKPQAIDFTTPGLPFWKFKVEAHLTDKGKNLVAQDQPPSELEALPLFRKKILEVTGITKTGQGTARAEYTWKAVSTVVGEIFDANGQFFKNLTTDNQQQLRRPVGLSGMEGSVVVDYNQIYKGVAVLQLFDDGWRVISIQ